MGRLDGDFQTFFTNATGSEPFAFQQAFAKEFHQLVNVPTGLGKTAMIVVAWLWRRNGGNESIKGSTPRRLVYCLPMRVLVEQTSQNVNEWIEKAGLKGKIDVHVLMGGEELSDWDMNPESDSIIIGTQDMLISRALNRGYAMSRPRWPMAFGLLHTDCLWVFDEIQLMGSGLATTAQLEAFRRILPNAGSESATSAHGCRSVWMSATMRPDWLETVDFNGYLAGLDPLKLSNDDRDNGVVKQRIAAKKQLSRATARIGDATTLAKEILTAHKPSTLTIVVVNTVKRACELFAALEKTTPNSSASPKLLLIHSRFRPADRKAAMDRLLDAKSGVDTIVVSTQVIEAGVDVSATTLFTELAPWASLVQRFGRCNRRGEANEHASVHWIDLPATDADADKARFPYELSDLRTAASHLKPLKDVGLHSLEALAIKLPFKHTHVIRRKDFIDLFDTTADLAGNDIDIDRFVREIDETDVRVFWRAWDRPKGFEAPSNETPAPIREELCAAPIGEFKDFAKANTGLVWRWDFLDEKWAKADPFKACPGQVYLVHVSAGGYSSERGWDPKEPKPVHSISSTSDATELPPDSNDRDRLSRSSVWQTIAEHTDAVCLELELIMKALSLTECECNALRVAARWHDFGKAHEVFQKKLPDGAPTAEQLWAKASGSWKRSVRKHFRHELASALAVLQPQLDIGDGDIDRDLVAYIIAAHHGKVRLSIRSFPDEMRPAMINGTTSRFARGVWHGDELPATCLGGSNGTTVMTPPITLSLEPMELGLCEEEPFIDQPSWCERMLRLRDTIGPFRLAYLETILRSADMRASAKAGQPKERG